MKPFFFPAGLIGVVVLAGCAVGPPATDVEPVKLPTSWREAGAFPNSSPDQDLTRWWTSFDDAEMSTLIRAALQANPDLLSAIANVRQAQAARREQASVLFPALGYNTSAATGYTFDRNAKNFSSQAYSAGLSAAWEVDLFGKNRQSLLAASADAESALNNRNAVQSSLAAETALAYLQLRSAEASLAVVEKSIASQEQTTELARWRSQAGDIDELELEQARAALESARAALSNSRQAISQARNRLNLLCGRTPSELAISSASAVPKPSRRLAIGIPADTVRQRPDVRAAGYGWLAAISRTRAAEAQRLPSLTLSGSLGTNSLSVSKFFNPQALTTNVIAGLSGPIFDAGRIRANIEGRDAAEEQAFQSYRASILIALSEVEDALIACRRSGERMAILETAAVSARTAAALAAQKYEAGVIDITPVLDTQRSELSVEQSLISARVDYSSAHIELYRALGGGW